MSASSPDWTWGDRQRNAGAPCRGFARRAIRWSISGHRRGYEQRQASRAIGVVPGADLACALLEIMH
jgi:hypothetical protein